MSTLREPQINHASLPVKKLAIAVLQQGLLDFADAVTPPTRGKMSLLEYEYALARHRDYWMQAEVVLFLTSEAPEWKRGRVFWCQGAEIDAAALRERVLGMLSLVKDGKGESVVEQIKGGWSRFSERTPTGGTDEQSDGVQDADGTRAA